MNNTQRLEDFDCQMGDRLQKTVALHMRFGTEFGHDDAVPQAILMLSVAVKRYHVIAERLFGSAKADRWYYGTEHPWLRLVR